MLLDVRVDRVDPFTRFRMGCHRGMLTDKHPRDVRPAVRRQRRRENFPATFPASGSDAFFGYFQKVPTKYGDMGLKRWLYRPKDGIDRSIRG